MKTKDDKLLILIAGKDAKAFDLFYRRYIRMIYKFVYEELNDQELTDDLIQEFWIRVWEDPSFLKCNGAGSVQGYMLQYLKFRILDLYRKTLTGLLRDLSAEKLEQEQDEYNNIVADLNEKELLDVIHEALKHQPAVIRNTFWMRINNWSVKETASTLSISPKTVYNKYSESLAVVRTYINNHYPEFATLHEYRAKE